MMDPFPSLYFSDDNKKKTLTNGGNNGQWLKTLGINRPLLETTIYSTNYPKLPNYQTWFLSFKRFETLSVRDLHSVSAGAFNL